MLSECPTEECVESHLEVAPRGLEQEAGGLGITPGNETEAGYLVVFAFVHG